MTHKRGVREPWLPPECCDKISTVSPHVLPNLSRKLMGPRAGEINYKVTTKLLGVLLAFGKESTYLPLEEETRVRGKPFTICNY